MLLMFGLQEKTPRLWFVTEFKQKTNPDEVKEGPSRLPKLRYPGPSVVDGASDLHTYNRYNESLFFTAS